MPLPTSRVHHLVTMVQASHPSERSQDAVPLASLLDDSATVPLAAQGTPNEPLAHENELSTIPVVPEEVVPIVEMLALHAEIPFPTRVPLLGSLLGLAHITAED
ncbi:hypothetical protein FRC09_005600 [Ceratobasidium sp. 395]|nr:hypothetical protein FRC09_005600 [Ceratobasidium sp. 395]